MNYGLWEFGNGTGVYRPENPHTSTEYKIVNSTVFEVSKKYPDAFILKTHGGEYQRAGIPDLYIALRGKDVWIEMKRPGADTTLLQKKKLEDLQSCGIFCGTAESPQTVIGILEKVLSF